MFTAVELEWLKAFLQKNILSGEYTHYVAYTIDNVSNNYNSEQFDFIVVLSNEDILQSGYTFSTQGNYKVVKVDSSSPSNNNQESRYEVSLGKGYSFSIQPYNHYFTNLKGSVNADLIYEDVLKLQNNQTDYILNLSLIILLCITLLHKTLTSAFPMRMGD